jgi:hypothetical protein
MMLSLRVQSCFLGAIVVVMILEMLVFYRHKGYRTRQTKNYWYDVLGHIGVAKRRELVGEVSTTTSATGSLRPALTVTTTNSR